MKCQADAVIFGVDAPSLVYASLIWELILEVGVDLSSLNQEKSSDIKQNTQIQKRALDEKILLTSM